MLRTYSFACALLLIALHFLPVAAAAGGGNTVTVGRPLHLPECISPQDGRLIQQFELFDGQGYPPDQTFYVVRHMGEIGSDELLGQIANEVTWDVGVFSGLHIPQAQRTDYQRGYRNDPVAGTNAFQLRCTGAGFLINTFQFEHSTGLVECPGGTTCSGGPHSGFFRVFGKPPTVFNTPSSKFSLHSWVKLPWVHWNEGSAAVGQVYLFAYFLDRTTGELVAWLAQIFDSRPLGNNNGLDHVSYDGIASFVSAPIRDTLADETPNPYLTRDPNSAVYHNLYRWQGERLYRAYLTQSQMATLLVDVNAHRASLDPPLVPVSEEPTDYSLAIVGLNVEVLWDGDTSREISIGGSWRDLSAYELYEVDPNGSR